MSKKNNAILSIIALIVVGMSITVYLGQYSSMKKTHSTESKQQNQNLSVNKHEYANNIVKPAPGQPIRKFDLVAIENNLQIKEGVNIPVWTYNGSVPGTEIRVTQGDFVQVKVKNLLSNPVTIHWHGYPLNSAMDGVPGLNQDAIKPGESFTYEFSADVPGTYWYHSHQEGAEQVDKGLYGALIVEPKDKAKPDKDFTLMLDEWTGNSSGMDMNSSNSKAKTAEEASAKEEEDMSTMYNIYTVNGKSGKLIEPLNVNKGDTVRLRFINSGYRSHGIHIPGTDIKVVSTDGQDINGAQVIKDNIVNISPGERYDVEFKVNGSDNFYIDFHDNNKFNDQIKIPVNVIGGSGKYIDEKNLSLQQFDLANYGIPLTNAYTLNQKYDKEYNIDLGVSLKSGNLQYTINGETFSELPPLKLKKDDIVKVTYTNKSNVDHPMHLHGHFFQVIAKNGESVKGAQMMKDTLMIKPNESYTIAFKADNPGNWVQHCHELHHAAAGMMQKIEYEGFKSNYTPNPKDTFNKPE